MPFGLRNAAQTFQCFMDDVTYGLEGYFNLLDNIFIANQTEEHLQHLIALFQRLNDHCVIINPSKRLFSVPSLTFLGHSISAEGLAPAQEKVNTITNFTRPDTLHQLCWFLGMLKFYKLFIPKCADLATPLNTMLVSPKKGCPKALSWTTSMETAFQNKEALS